VLLTLTSTAPPATDLGYLLHKHPDRVQSFALPVGTAHVFYPEATEARCTAALLLEVDPIELVRGKRFGGDGVALAQYVNDRPYAASSMLAVALGRVFGSALRGECKTRPELLDVALPLQIHVAAVPCTGGVAAAQELFAPLGWTVTAAAEPLDPEISLGWGDSRYLDLRLTGTMRLAEALSQLYVLLPVMDGAKHYWVAGDEVDKLIARAGGWLQTHPRRELIIRRYLAHQRSLVADATERLNALDDQAPNDQIDDTESEKPPKPLVRQRITAVLDALRRIGAHRVVDLGCGEGALLRELLAQKEFAEVVGVDVSARELDRAARSLSLDRMPDRQRARITLLQSSAVYRDRRLAGYDAVVLMEVVEHLDPERLPALERCVFEFARPTAVLVTTPNAEYNVRYPNLAPGGMRHPDHRFEWSRAEFGRWTDDVSTRYGYDVERLPVGEVDAEVGPPTQLALFRRTRA
jgi:3' terminal RNA ribose 2'-O-methyltransferase Hen1